MKSKWILHTSHAHSHFTFKTSIPSHKIRIVFSNFRVPIKRNHELIGLIEKIICSLTDIFVFCIMRSRYVPCVSLCYCYAAYAHVSSYKSAGHYFNIFHPVEHRMHPACRKLSPFWRKCCETTSSYGNILGLLEHRVFTPHRDIRFGFDGVSRICLEVLYELIKSLLLIQRRTPTSIGGTHWTIRCARRWVWHCVIV